MNEQYYKEKETKGSTQKQKELIIRELKLSSVSFMIVTEIETAKEGEMQTRFFFIFVTFRYGS